MLATIVIMVIPEVVMMLLFCSKNYHNIQS
jgi:hypothetical protein